MEQRQKNAGGNGRWKAAHHASRRFFAPLLLPVKDEGERRGIFVISEGAGPWAGELRWLLETPGGGRLGGTDAVFSGNYFDLPAGREVLVEYVLPAGWRLEQARERLRVRSPHDSS